MCIDRQMGQAYLRWVLGAGGIGGVGLVPLPTELRSFGNGIWVYCGMSRDQFYFS